MTKKRKYRTGKKAAVVFLALIAVLLLPILAGCDKANDEGKGVVPFAGIDKSDIISINIQIENDNVVIDDREKVGQYVDAMRKVITYGEENAENDAGDVQRVDTICDSDGTTMTITPLSDHIYIDGISYRADLDSVNYLDYTAYFVVGHKDADPEYFGVEHLVDVSSVPSQDEKDEGQDGMAGDQQSTPQTFDPDNGTTYPPFTEEEIAAARNVVMQYFEALGAGDAEAVDALSTPIARGSEITPADAVQFTVKRLSYDTSGIVRQGYIRGGRGSVNGVSPENVIGFFSDYGVHIPDSNSASLGAWEEGEKSNWMFILIRENKEAPWLIDDQGY
ncbi:MAG: DUF4829 domain-containing protein [Clostridiales Family XIII bacterium]|nr:DUF4829 domain-containing protein [Clostridiales Family XIII bacterium]